MLGSKMTKKDDEERLFCHFFFSIQDDNESHVSVILR